MRYKTSNMSELHYDFLRSLKAKRHGAIGLPIYVFLLMYDGNEWPNSGALLSLLDARLQNPSNLERSNLIMVQFGLPKYITSY